MWPAIGAAISGGASLLGGLMSTSASKEAAAEQRAQTDRMNALQLSYQTQRADAADAAQRRGEEFAAQQFAAARDQWERNFARQDEYARMGIRMKMSDALAAGLHPLYALGGSGPTFSPSTMSTFSFGAPSAPAGAHLSTSPSSSASIGPGLAAMGQDIGRAVAATQTADERMANVVLTQQALERGGLENDLLRARIAQIRGSSGPALPSGGPDPFGVGDVLSGAMGARNARGGSQIGTVESDRLGFTAGTQAGTSVFRDPGEIYATYPSKNLKEVIEDVAPYEWEDYLKKRLMPEFSSSYRDAVRPKEVLAPGYVWHGLLGHWWKSPRNRYSPVLGR